MKTYEIKYQSYSGNVYTVTRTGYSQVHAESQLHNCKEIYWTRLASEQVVRREKALRQTTPLIM